jgi:hypothetical protein
MSQVSGYIDEIPMLEYRRSWPVAVMIAQFGNFSGGRPKSKPKKAPDSVPYKPEDFFPYMWFAQYGPYLESVDKESGKKSNMGIDTETAKLIVSLNSREIGGKQMSALEPWMVAAFGPAWDEIVRAAEG